MFEHLNKIRFLIIILVIINHLNFSPNAVSGGIVNNFAFFIESTSPLLAILSGYLFFNGTREKFNYLDKLKRRYYSLVLPYLFWTTLYIVMHAIIKPLALFFLHRPVWLSADPTFNLGFLARAFIIDPIIPNYWYLQNLIAILPFCYLIWHLLHNRTIYFVMFCGVILIYSFNVFPIFFHQRFLPYFLIGAYLGYHQYRWNIFSSWNKTSVNLLLLATLSLPSFFEYDNGGLILKCICVFTCAALFIQSFNRGFPEYLDRFLAQNERHSFIVFCLHTIVISAISKILALMLPGFLFRNMLTCCILYLVLFVIVLMINLWMSRILEKHFQPVWNFLVGYRHVAKVHISAAQNRAPKIRKEVLHSPRARTQRIYIVRDDVTNS